MRALATFDDLAPAAIQNDSSRFGWVRHVIDVAFYEAVLAGGIAGVIGEALFGGWMRAAVLAAIAALTIAFVFSAYRAGTLAWASGETARGIFFVVLAAPVSLVLCLGAALNAGFANTCLVQTAACTYDLSLPFVAFSASALLFALAAVLAFLVAPGMALASTRRP